MIFNMKGVRTIGSEGNVGRKLEMGGWPQEGLEGEKKEELGVEGCALLQVTRGRLWLEREDERRGGTEAFVISKYSQAQQLLPCGGNG